MVSHRVDMEGVLRLAVVYDEIRVKRADTTRRVRCLVRDKLKSRIDFKATSAGKQKE